METFGARGDKRKVLVKETAADVLPAFCCRDFFARNATQVIFLFFVFLKLPDTPTDRRSKDIESARSDRESKEDNPATPEPRTPLYLGRSVFEAATFQVKSTDSILGR